MITKLIPLITLSLLFFALKVESQTGPAKSKPTKTTNNLVGYWLSTNEDNVGKYERTLLFRPNFTGKETEKLDLSTTLSGDDCPTTQTMTVDFTYRIEKDTVVIKYAQTEVKVFVRSYPNNETNKLSCETWRKQKEINQRKIYSERNYYSYALPYSFMGNS